MSTLRSEETLSYTPGPWHVGTAHEDPQFQSVLDERDRCLADISFHKHTDTYYPFRAESEANARLIAAAPRMYELIAKLAKGGDAEAISILESIHASA